MSGITDEAMEVDPRFSFGAEIMHGQRALERAKSALHPVSINHKSSSLLPRKAIDSDENIKAWHREKHHVMLSIAWLKHPCGDECSQ